MNERERAAELLQLRDGRGALKRAASALDREPELRAAVLSLARANGIELPDDATDWPGKRLLRAARARSEGSQEIRSPIARDEGFVCAVCGRETPPHGRSARDHCPYCLRSMHVDVIPGDRASDCGGVLEPLAVEQRGSKFSIHYRCARCGAARVNQALLDGAPADDWEQIVKLSARDAR